ncbi:MAG: ABC transporter ATP-binding protein/permease [Brevundimonas sp.]
MSRAVSGPEGRSSMNRKNPDLMKPEAGGTGRNLLWADLRHVGRMLGQYLKGDPVWSVVLFGAQLAAGAAGAVLGLQIQQRLAAITNALGEGDGSQIASNTTVILGLVAGLLVIGVAVIFAQYALRMRFRRVVTQKLLGRWLADNRFFHMERRQGLDYPEQRIQEDVFQTIDGFLRLAPEVTIGLLTVFLYVGQLWMLSPPMTVPALGINQPIPGLLVYGTLAFAVSLTLLTHWVGVRLTRTEVARQSLEARYRQEMAAVRHNGETIAFTRAAGVEESRLSTTFGLIRRNWSAYTSSTLAIQAITGVPTSLLIIAPTLLFAPFVLNGSMGIGDVNLIGVSILSVYVGAGILMSNYVGLALLRSAIARLRLLHEQLEVETVSDIVVRTDIRDDIQTHDLRIAFPNGEAMNDVGDLTIRKGDRLLIQGRSGAGKSTLLRAIAGLWPEGEGAVTLPAGARIVFLPQRPYMPDGTIAGLLSYPDAPDANREPVYIDLLERLDLGRLIDSLHEHGVWVNSLSPGEQQRVAAARAILSAPDYLFVDEATSALDPQLEAVVYKLIEERLPGSAVISVAHRPAVAEYHSSVLRMEAGACARTPLTIASDA